MHAHPLITLFAAVLLLGVSARAHADGQSKVILLCFGAGLIEQQISACSVLIEASNTATTTLVDALVNRGNALRRQHQYGLAIEDYDRAIQIHPNLDYAYIFRGIAHLGNGDYRSAVADFTQSLSTDRFTCSMALAQYGLGLARQALGNAQGLEDVAEARAIFPNVRERFGEL